MKRFLSLFLCFLICLSFLPAPEALALGEWDPDEGVKSIRLSVDTPQVGEHPNCSFSFTPSDAADTDGSEIVWQQLQPTEVDPLEEDFVFVEGGVYQITIWLSAMESFDPDMTVTVNGQPATVESSDEMGWAGHFIFPALPTGAETISGAAATITAPAAGALQSNSPTLPSGAHYRCVMANWYDLTADCFLNYSNPFEGGHQYKAIIFLEADEGYKFTSASTGTINGKTAACEIENGWLKMSYTFPQLKNGSWKKDSTGWWYQRGDGTYPKNQWERINGQWYHFDAKGYMQVGWQKFDGQWYYLGTSGAMTVGWKQIGGKWYRFSASGVMAVGWKYISGKWYYFNTSGVMLTGWQKIDGKYYYFNSSGAMLTGWQKISNKWYWFDSSGVMQTGWQTISGKTYYFQSGGAMVTGVQQIGGKWYYFESSGAQYKTAGWKQISGKWYYFDSAGVAKVGWLKLSGKWYWFNASAQMVTGWQKISGKWYWFDSSGVMFANGDKTIGGKTYHFDQNGVCTNP